MMLLKKEIRQEDFFGIFLVKISLNVTDKTAKIANIE